jgi:hypothetical protein
MSYGSFDERITERGASAIKRDRDAKTTSFVYKDKTWGCVDKKRAAMTAALADGYEMDYCLNEYCTVTEG